MSALEIHLPLEPLPSPPHWAWLLALCMATIATFSRLSLPWFLMHSKTIEKLFSFSRLSQQENGAEHVESKLHDAAAVSSADSQEEQIEVEKPWSLAYGRTGEDSSLEKAAEDEVRNKGNRRAPFQAAGEEENRGGRTGEDKTRENIPPPWVYSLLETSNTSDDASSIRTPPSSLSSSWSQALQSRISARIGKHWDILESCQLSLLHAYPPRLFTSETVRKLLCRQRHILSLLQAPPSLLSFMSAVEIDSQGQDFARMGFCSGEMWLWDIEKGVCVNRVCGRKSPVSSLGVLASLNNPRIAIAVGPHYLYSESSLVTVWDDRCMLRNTDYGITTTQGGGKMGALASKAYDICIARGEFVALYDARMLREEPFCIYSSQYVSNVDVEGQEGQGNICRNDVVEGKDESSHELWEQLEGCATTILPSSSSSHLHNIGPPQQGRRRCPLIIGCLPFMHLLDKREHSFLPFGCW